MDLEDKIKSILPSLSQELLQQLNDKLLEAGVESEEDLKFVTEGDFSILKPIQARKLLDSWSGSGN